MGSRQFLKLCSRQCNGRRSEMPRKWQVQLGPNFIKHNPICALILPKRLAADAALPDEKEKKKKKKRKKARKPVEVFQNCRLNCRFAFPFSFLPSLLLPLLPLPLLFQVTKFVARRIHHSQEFIDYETFDSKKTDALTRIKLEPFSFPASFFLFSFSFTRGREIRPQTDTRTGKTGGYHAL